MRRTLRLRSGRFAREALTTQAHNEQASPDEIASRAAVYFASGAHGCRPARQLPRGLPATHAETVELHLELSEQEWASLESEARGRGVVLERLLEHALLLYLADVTSGRITETILHRADEDG